MTVDNIYLTIAQQICRLIEDDKWESAIFKIKRQENHVGFNGHYFDQNKNKQFLDVWNMDMNTDIIHKLHAITTEGGHNRWNKLEFTLLPDGKFDLQFIWDQEWQDEINGYNKKVESCILGINTSSARPFELCTSLLM